MKNGPSKEENGLDTTGNSSYDIIDFKLEKLGSGLRPEHREDP